MIPLLGMGIRENIIQNLMEGSLSVNQLRQKFPNNKNKFIETYKQMIKDDDLTSQKEGNKIILSLGRPKPLLSLSHVMSSLPLAEQRADKILKRLDKSKPLFIRGKLKDFEKLPMKINPKNKRNLDKILIIINDLVSRSVALTYAQCFDSFPKKSEKIIHEYHKKCIHTIRKIMDKLENQHKESDLELGSYLYYGVNGYSHLTTLMFLAKNH